MKTESTVEVKEEPAFKDGAMVEEGTAGNNISRYPQRIRTQRKLYEPGSASAAEIGSVTLSDPETYVEAMASDDRVNWKNEIEAELQS